MNRKKILTGISAAVVLLCAIAAGFLLRSPEKTGAHTVTFTDWDGEVLKTESVETGKAATPPADPLREGYTFIGWNKAFSFVVKDTVITAEYLRITETAFKVDTVTVAADTKKVELKVSVANNPGILGMVFSVNYDEEALRLIDCENGVALSALAFQTPSNLASGCNFVWYGSKTGTVADGEVLTLTFEVAEGAKPGNYPISVSWKDSAICDGNGDVIDPDVTQGAIILK